MNLVFKKSGQQIKEAIVKRRRELNERLEKRNQTLDEFIQDTSRLRSYLIRSTRQVRGHGTASSYMLASKSDISSEEQEEIDQLCRRIFEIDQERRRLGLIAAHLDDDEIFELSFNELVSYGFDLDL